MDKERIDEIIDQLRGTCLDFFAVLDDDEDPDDADLLAYLDEEIFCCDTCSWWCDRDEGHTNPDGGEDICDDCHKEKDDESED